MTGKDCYTKVGGQNGGEFIPARNLRGASVYGKGPALALLNGGNMNGVAVSPCEFAIERYRNIAKWRNMWTILLFIFGATVIIFLCGSILLFIRESWLPGAIATLGTIVNGVGVSWVLSRRTDAVKEEEEAYQDVQSKCPAAQASMAPQIQALQSRQKLFMNIR